MIAGRLELADAQLDSPLGRTSPVVKLAIAVLWLGGLALCQPGIQSDFQAGYRTHWHRRRIGSATASAGRQGAADKQ